MSKHMTNAIPEEDTYTVAQIDGRWYPLKVGYIYDESSAKIYHTFKTLWDLDGNEASYDRRANAVEACHHDAEEQVIYEQSKWQRLAVQTNVYPDRCSHYREVIEEVTGYPPRVEDWFLCFGVIVRFAPCCHCQLKRGSLTVSALTVDDALAEAAERAYTEAQVCVNPHCIARSERSA